MYAYTILLENTCRSIADILVASTTSMFEMKTGNATSTANTFAWKLEVAFKYKFDSPVVWISLESTKDYITNISPCVLCCVCSCCSLQCSSSDFSKEINVRLFFAQSLHSWSKQFLWGDIFTKYYLYASPWIDEMIELKLKTALEFRNNPYDNHRLSSPKKLRSVHHWTS